MQEKAQDNSIFKSRILDFLRENGIKQADFYRISGITRGILTQSNGMSEDNVLKFFKHYPHVNPDWFITGKGNMTRDFSTMQEKTQEKTQENKIQPLNEDDVGVLKEENRRLMRKIIDLQDEIIKINTKK